MSYPFIRTGAVFEALPDAQWRVPEQFLVGARGVSRAWTFGWTRADGARAGPRV